MSATGRGAPADKLGRYYTDELVARAIVQRCVERRIIRPGYHVLEPSSGGGAFLDALAELGGVSLYAMDINPDAPTMCARGTIYQQHRGNFLSDYPTTWPQRVDVVIGNPPYSVTPDGQKRPVDAATPHSKAAIARTRRHVVFLLRAGFRGAPKRGIRRKFFLAHPPREVWPVWPRPSFSGGGTDASEYTVFWWDKAYQGPTIESPIEWLDDWKV